MILIIGWFAISLTCGATTRTHADDYPTAKQRVELLLDEVDRLLDEQQYKKACEKAQAMLQTAISENRSWETLIAAAYVTEAEKEFTEEPMAAAIKRYEELYPMLSTADQAMCAALLSKILTSYQSSMTTDEQQRQQKLEYYLKLSLEPIDLLWQTPAKRYERILSKYPESPTAKNILLTPTLLDLVVHNAIYCKQYNNPIQDNTDTALKLLEMLYQKHSADPSFDGADAESILIYLDIEKTRLILNNGFHSWNEQVAVWTQLIEKYRESESAVASRLYAEAATLLNANGKYTEALHLCDTVEARYQNDEGVAACKNIRLSIISPSIAVSKPSGTETTDKESMIGVTLRNIDTLYCQIVERQDNSAPTQNGRNKNTNSKAPHLRKPLTAWQQPIAHPDDHQPLNTYCYIPPMPIGDYVLILSPTNDIDSDNYTTYLFKSSELVLLTAEHVHTEPHAAQLSGTLRSGYVLNRNSGLPIAGAQVRLQSANRKTHTDTNGWYSLDLPATQKKDKLMIETANESLTLQTEPPYIERPATRQLHCSIFTDRPVYRLDETIQATVVVYSNQYNDPHTEPNKTIHCRLARYWNDTLASQTVTPDADGRAPVALHIPADALPGRHTIVVTQTNESNTSRPTTTTDSDHEIGRHSINIEQYKQPHFKITMNSEDRDKRADDTITVSGLLTSYTGIAVAKARITYTVNRSKMGRWWWDKEDEGIVHQGETWSDEEGHFEITFDNSTQDTNTTYLYTVKAIATDINGETHEASCNRLVGDNDSWLEILTPEDVDTLKEITYRCQTLNGTPAKRDIEITVAELEAPATTRIKHPNHIEGYQNTLTETEFRSRFAEYQYDGDDETRYPIKEICYTLRTQSNDTGDNKIAVGIQPDGLYRISIATQNHAGKRIECSKIIHVTSHDATRPQSDKLLWCHVNKTTAIVGDTIIFRMGSRQHNVNTFYEITIGRNTIAFDNIRLDNNIKTIKIPITEAMKGNFTINATAIKYGRQQDYSQTIAVPYHDKKLTIDFESFRDKVTPGSNEEWKIRIKDSEGQPISAAMILTLYDAALDHYGMMNWTLWPWKINTSHSHLRYYENTIDIDYRLWNMMNDYGRSTHIPYYDQREEETTAFYGYTIEKGIATQRLKYLRMTSMAYAMPKSGNLNRAMMMNDMMSETESVTPQKMMLADEAKLDAGLPTDITETPLRENLSTHGIYLPQLQSDSNGSLTATFRAPEALTTWNLLGIAYTQQLSTGTKTKQLITSKPIMVEPMVPRYMREGDSAELKVKITNHTETDDTLMVSIKLTDTENGSLWQKETLQKVTISKKESQAVGFAVVVPHGIERINYEIRAKGRYGSDGERNQIPVLSNRQTVTESQAMYLNGIGEKQYTLPTLENTQTRKVEQLSVEYTANPIWHAVNTLPYISLQENPSNIYLGTAIYVNKLSRNILDEQPTIETMVAEERAAGRDYRSRLHQNEAIQNSKLTNSPYLPDAQNEEERAAKVAIHFDRNRIDDELTTCIKKLNNNQNSDGGWCWIAGQPKSDEYATRRILQTLGNLNADSRTEIEPAITKALLYLDQIAYNKYQYYKKHKITDALDINYLYIRSMYSQHSIKKEYQEAYNYFWNNAQKHNKKITSLYHTAELALILNRNGERQMAKTLLNRLLQKSLTNDEMGIYWRDNVSGLLYEERPIEVQSMIIKAFAEIMPNASDTIAQMQQWLLKQRQTTLWNSDIATIDALGALLLNQHCGKTVATGEGEIRCGQDTITSQGAAGYAQKTWKGSELTDDHRTITIAQKTNNIGWGAAYWQYSDETSKITNSAMGVTLHKETMRKNADGKWVALHDGDSVRLGEKLRVEIAITCDRTLEYIELRDGRPSGCEPTDTYSGWRWSDGTSYYCVVLDYENKMYINHIEKGKHVTNYEMYANQCGTYESGVTTLQSLYAPEFRAVAPSIKLNITE
ncbi:MAG: hypothetical protein KBT04_05600 [Bacteroidales bacterium]|nr:hypothetical protein [Candidatus Colimorpha onthohippi]